MFVDRDTGLIYLTDRGLGHAHFGAHRVMSSARRALGL